MERRFKLLPQQTRFLQCQEPEVMFVGGYAGGKSIALCVKAVARASIPGAVEMIARKHLSQLRYSTLRTLLSGENEMPPILSYDMIKNHHKTDKRIELYGGGTIYYSGIDEESIGSRNLSGVHVDEAAELTESEIDALAGRVRLSVQGLPNQLCFATNPAGPLHPLALRFGVNDFSKRRPGCVYFTCTPRQNIYLSPKYLERLELYTGSTRARYLEGRWVQKEGLTFPNLTSAVIDHEDPPPGMRVGGVDFGWRSPYCALMASVYKDESERNIIYVFEEYYKSHTPVKIQTQILKRMQGENEAHWFCDTSAPEHVLQYRSADILAHKANKGIIEGIDCVNARLVEGTLIISRRCENTIMESMNYAYPVTLQGKPEDEKPVKENDHAMDALRYLVMGVQRLAGRVSFDEDEEGEDDGQEETGIDSAGYREVAIA